MPIYLLVHLIMAQINENNTENSVIYIYYKIKYQKISFLFKKLATGRTNSAFLKMLGSIEVS